MRFTRVQISVALLAVLAAGVALFVLSSRTARETLDLAAEGGEIQLREPMRPIRGGPRVLLIALDGVGQDRLAAQIRDGRMPRLAALLGAKEEPELYAHAVAFTNVMSILPSTTMAAWASVFTGRPVSETGIAGNEWYARDEQKFYAPGPISVDSYAHTLEMYSNDLIGRALKVPTLYEQANVRAHVSLAPVSRGADLLTVPSPQDVAELFGRLAKGVIHDEPATREIYSTLDENSVERILNTFDSHGMPDLQVAYFPGVDLFTHLAENPLQEMKQYLEEIIDPLLGRLFDAYAKAGLIRDTFVVITSDHGHTPVLNDPHHALGTGKEGEPPELLRKIGFRVRPFQLELSENENDYQAVLAYQGAFSYVYLADRSTCPNPGERCQWSTPPRFGEDVMAVVRAFHNAHRAGILVPELQGTLDLIFAREPQPLDVPARPFEVFDGERLVPIGDYLRANPRPDLIQLEERLHALAAGPFGHRAGDVLLLARSGMNRPIKERYYFSGLYHSWHGSPEREDSNVPLVVARAGQSGRNLQERALPIVGEFPSHLHVVPLVLDLLGVTAPE